MFTGLVQAMGTLEQRELRGGDLRVRIGTGGMSMADVQLGESICVSGICLTVVELDVRSFHADVSTETMALTTLGELAVGAPVNLERAMLPTTRLGGHLVAGHVDGLGRVESVRSDARSQRWRFSLPAELCRYVATKGSICVDGVSLTVNATDQGSFDVNLVPHTIAHTAFASTLPGSLVNIEVDLVARYLERLAQFPRANLPLQGFE